VLLLLLWPLAVSTSIRQLCLLLLLLLLLLLRLQRLVLRVQLPHVLHDASAGVLPVHHVCHDVSVCSCFSAWQMDNLQRRQRHEATE
jgi:hypothetical protein